MERDEETMEKYVGILPRSKLTSPSSEQINCCGQPELGGRTVDIGSAMMDVEGRRECVGESSEDVGVGRRGLFTCAFTKSVRGVIIA